MGVTTLNICRADTDAYQEYDGKTTRLRKGNGKTDSWNKTTGQKKNIRCKEHVALLKWSWAEHTVRQTRSRWNKKILQWKPWARRRNLSRTQTSWTNVVITKKFQLLLF